MLFDFGARGFHQPAVLHARGAGRLARPARKTKLDVLDVGVAEAKLIDLPRVDIDADHGEAALAEQQHEWKTNIAEADDADGGFAVRDFLEEFFFRHRTQRIRPASQQ